MRNYSLTGKGSSEHALCRIIAVAVVEDDVVELEGGGVRSAHPLGRELGQEGCVTPR